MLENYFSPNCKGKDSETTENWGEIDTQENCGGVSDRDVEKLVYPVDFSPWPEDPHACSLRGREEMKVANGGISAPP